MSAPEAALPPFAERVRAAVGDAHLHEAIDRATGQLQARRGAAFASLEAAGLRVVETDLGEYVVQLRADRPSHIILPIIHLTKEDVGRTMEERLAVPYTSVPQELCALARARLRAEFLEADLGISGGNFAIVESGSIGLVSNEGNIRMVTTLPRVHVALVGIEKLVPTLADWERMVQVLARSATGQKITVYTTLVNGPRRTLSDEGPEQVHVILLDHGRSATLAGDEAEILACIRCGACLNVCPVFRNIGGHAYGDTYPGPMGAVLTPSLRGLPGWQELPQASSLCGACRDVCPVRIDLPRLLLSLRAKAVEREPVALAQRLFMKAYAFLATRPRLLRLAMKLARAFALRRARAGWVGRSPGLPGLFRGWTEQRDWKVPAARTFDDWWEQRRGSA
jgi:L-lactate dehydrogenase complex protein LldF